MVERSELVFRKINTLDEAKAWLRDLIALDLMFHLEDDPADIGNQVNGEWIKTFTAAEAVAVAERQRELYGLDWGPDLQCPIGYFYELNPLED